jgi:hypothetical protein
MPDETYVVELVAEPEKFAAGVRKAVNDLNKIEQTGRKIAAGEKASADAAVRGYNAARARRDAAFSELSIVQKLVGLEQRRAQLIGFMAAAVNSGNSRRQALLGQGLASVSASSYMIASGNPGAAREATTIIDTGVPNRGGGGRSAGRRAPIALIGPPGDAGGSTLASAGAGAAAGRGVGGVVSGWFEQLGLKGMAKLTGVGFAIGAIVSAGREILSWPDIARQQSSEARKLEASLKKQFEWSRGTRDNLAGAANYWTFITSALKGVSGWLIGSMIEIQKRMYRLAGLGRIVDKFFPDTSNEEDPVAREMENRRIAEDAEIEANAYFKKKAKQREIRSAMVSDLQTTIPAMFSRDSRAQAGIYSTSGGEFWSKQTVAIQRQLLEELIHNTTATKDVETAVKSSGSF